MVGLVASKEARGGRGDSLYGRGRAVRLEWRKHGPVRGYSRLKLEGALVECLNVVDVIGTTAALKLKVDPHANALDFSVVVGNLKTLEFRDNPGRLHVLVEVDDLDAFRVVGRQRPEVDVSVVGKGEL